MKKLASRHHKHGSVTLSSPYEHGSWEDLLWHIDRGDYAEAYSSGETLSLDLGSLGTVDMEISDFDVDTLAESNGTAPVTMIARQILPIVHRWNPALSGNATDGYDIGTGGIGGWPESEIRQWMHRCVFPEIPEKLRSRIALVKKASTSFTTSGGWQSNALSSDRIWIPSIAELNYRPSHAETAFYGGTLSALSTPSKRKRGTPTNAFWFTRSCRTINTNNLGMVMRIPADGVVGNTNMFTEVQKAMHILICFCLK